LQLSDAGRFAVRGKQTYPHTDLRGGFGHLVSIEV
jgi:hypothetical protein